MAKKDKIEKDDQPVVTGGSANASENTEAKDKVEEAIFGGDAVPRVEETKIDQPAQTQPTGMSQGDNSGKVILDRQQFENIMQRLNDLDSVVMAGSRQKDDVFNPLAEVKTDHIVKIAFHGDKMVVGYKGKVRVDGKEVFTFMQKEPITGEVRTYATLLLQEEDGSVSEETVDFVGFLEGAVMLNGKLKNRQDIGQIVEQGEVEVMTWNGQKLVPSGTRIMSGAKEQKWIFTVELNGKTFELPENVVNIK